MPRAARFESGPGNGRMAPVAVTPVRIRPTEVLASLIRGCPMRLVPPADPRSDSAAYFRNRQHVPHLDNPAHQPRLHRCAQLADWLIHTHNLRSVTDLGCGDGGLLSLLTTTVPGWGYDVREASIANARPGIDVRHADILTDPLELGDLVMITEVLEHLHDPAALLANLDAKWLIASSPADENRRKHDHTHVWAWDPAGYADMIQAAGWHIASHEHVGRFQIVTARRG